jgi:GNAT superfamily N-acetyltransferase
LPPVNAISQRICRKFSRSFSNFDQASVVDAPYVSFVWIRSVRAAHNCLVLAIRSSAAEHARRSVLKSGYPMYEPLLSGGTVRRLWIGEAELYRQHLLRLDGKSRRNRFGGAVSDEFVGRYAQCSALSGAVIYGFLVDGVLRGAAELRPLERAGDAEGALSVEKPWQSRGVGTARLDRVLLAAHNRQIERLHMLCLAENRRVQQLARKFGAQLSFAPGSITAEVEAPRADAAVDHARARGRRHRPRDRDARRPVAAR